MTMFLCLWLTSTMFVALLGANFFTPGSSTAGICGTRRAVTRGTERRVSVNKLRACQCVGELSMMERDMILYNVGPPR